MSIAAAALNTEATVISAEVNWNGMLIFFIALALVVLIFAVLIQSLRYLTMKIAEYKATLPEHPADARRPL